MNTPSVPGPFGVEFPGGQTTTRFRGVIDVGKTFNPNTVFDPSLGVPSFPLRIRLDGDTADISLGGVGQDGDVFVRSATGEARIHLDGGGANAWLGGNGADGDIVLFPSGADNLNDLGQASIHLDGQAGDITLRNADFAEDFDASSSDVEAEPGTVMTLDDDGDLRPSEVAYDRHVAGVVPGAGEYRSAIVMDRKPSSNHRVPIALVGKVFCRVDADPSAIAVGDLLTTSTTPGHAMKATDRDRAFGAVIGKALRPRREGLGLIPILVALQ